MFENSYTVRTDTETVSEIEMYIKFSLFLSQQFHVATCATQHTVNWLWYMAQTQLVISAYSSVS